MSNPDRRTTISGDQIEDYSIEPSEINAENSPSNYKSLIYIASTEKFKWMHQLIIGQIFK